MLEYPITHYLLFSLMSEEPGSEVGNNSGWDTQKISSSIS